MNLKFTEKFANVRITAIYQKTGEIYCNKDFYLFSLTFLENENFNNYLQFIKIPIIKINNRYCYLFFVNNNAIEYTRIFENADFSKIEWIFFCADELKKFGILNIINIAELCDYLVKETADKNLIIEFLKFANIKPTAENFEILKKISKLAIMQKQKILELEFNRDLIEILFLFSPEQQSALLDFFKKIHFSLNDKKKVLIYLFELIKKKYSFYDILEDCCAVFAKTKSSEKIISHIFNLRYPIISAKQKQLNEVINKLNAKNKNIKFEY
ncbi:MAG TPA: hypothetical protein PLJ38_07030, partial [bacterium]|nr:hypothetical protein [bacterium]